MAVKIGLRDLHYAPVTSDNDQGIVYGTPKKIAGAVSATVAPNVSSDSFYADDGPMDTVTNMGEVELSISVADIPLEDLAVLLGHTINATTKVISKKAGAIPPFVAIGFKSIKSNGKYKFVWLTKGKFREPEDNFETKTDSANFQPASIVGSFVKREFDDVWQHVTDEDAEGFVPAVATNWFTAVEPSAI